MFLLIILYNIVKTSIKICIQIETHGKQELKPVSDDSDNLIALRLCFVNKTGSSCSHVREHNK